jgi:hypothetical protein
VSTATAKAKGALKSKGVWAGPIIATLGLVQTNLDKLPLNESQMNMVWLAAGLALIWVRWVTDRPLDQK